MITLCDMFYLQRELTNLLKKTVHSYLFKITNIGLQYNGIDSFAIKTSIQHRSTKDEISYNMTGEQGLAFQISCSDIAWRPKHNNLT